ncbi:MAG: SPOR domain-containing protein [Deltaproteobacteria bacterium]|nr:SPOR domain-containing protein [Deltaproteobacteria bacterium]
MSRRYDSYVTDLPQGSGGMFKWAVISAGVGIAFGAGMVLGQGGARDEVLAAHSPQYAENELKAASASTKKLHEVRERAFRFQFHKELKGQKPHPAALATEEAVKTASLSTTTPPKPAPPKPVPQVPSIGLTNPPLEKVALQKPTNLAARQEPFPAQEKAVAPSADAFEASHSATENKDEHQSNMSNLRQALLRVLGDDAPVWDAGMTPPPLSSVKKSAVSAPSGGVADDVIADDEAEKETQANAESENKLLPRKPTKIVAEVKVAKATPKAVVAARVEAPKLVPAVKATTSSFAVQVASVTSHEAAKRVAAELSAKGFRAQIVEAVVNGNQVFRVRVPGFATRDAASEVKSKLGKGFVTAN